MVTNILKAMIAIKKGGNFNLSKINVFSKGRASAVNRANSMGEALEYFTKDAFCDTFQEADVQKKKEIYGENFSYLGNQNNPPDIIIKDGDAIEVKKIDGVRLSDLALNSSYPKSKLYSDSLMITSACRTCEKWIEKDIIYAVGHIDNYSLKILSLVYGDCYAASKGIYERIKDKISDGLKEMNLEFSETKELGRVNRVDPLGITNLRIRGMWTIQNPLKVYKELFKLDDDDFQLFALMRKAKYDSFPEEDRDLIEKEVGVFIDDVKIQDPDNPAKLIVAKLIVVRK
ncbi:MAG: NgoPII family restriction endonuclease [Nanoarchaeota archaeon]|nr:NgoPII family restriction endonuclease [Nanoarchaeota archaeon]